jgi:hypothetical protein
MTVFVCRRHPVEHGNVEGEADAGAGHNGGLRIDTERAVVGVNELIYKARMALKDIMEVNITTPGSGKVYLTFLPHLVWEGATEAHREKVIGKIIDCLGDMGMDLAGGQAAIPTLLSSEPVEIVGKAA